MVGCILGKRILIIGAGIEQVYAYKLAKKLGIQVIGTDINPYAPAFEFSDDKIFASTRDPVETWEGVEKFIKSKTISGVMTLANDVPYTVAYVANKLDLPSIPLESAKLASNKLDMKEKFLKDDIHVPDFCEIKTVKELKKKVSEWKYPVIIKPIDNRGARGVLRITKEVDSDWAFREALNNSESGRVILEKFIEGPQISTEGFVLNGKCYTVAFSDRNYEYLDKYSPYIIENGGNMPSKLPYNIIIEIKKMIQKAASSLGIENGPIKGDVVVDKYGKPYIIEIAARLSGGYFCTDQIPLATGVDLVKVTMLQALGEKIDKNELVSKCKRYVAIRYWFPKIGKLKSIPNIDEIKDEKFIYTAEIHKKPGEMIKSIQKHPDRLGFVISYCEKSYNMAAEIAVKIINKYQDNFGYF